MGYKPNIAVHPGQIIARALTREGMTQKSLSARTGLTEKHLSQVINGEASITVETALRLENALGGAASFWINLEKNYQETKARIDRQVLLKEEVNLLRNFPYAELVKRCFVEATRKRIERVQNLWKFFGVNSLNFVAKTEAVAYRRRNNDTIKNGAVAAWLRCGELESRSLKTNEFSVVRLKKSLPLLRKLTLLEAREFSTRAQDIMGEAGVLLVYVPHFPGTGVSGACRWIGANPVIQLSLLGAYADMFWFNLFHEIGHILLHGKKAKFIEFNDKDLAIDQEKEREADEFAGNALIPNRDYLKFIDGGDFSKRAMAHFANSIGIDPGIIEGRLCYDAVTDEVSWSKSLGFRSRLKFAN